MIKTIDDLRKRYAVRDDKEVFELFMSKCEEFGITWNPESPREINFGEAVVFDGANSGYLSHQSEPYMIDRNYKRLTISDFKSTRTEYEKVTESIFDLRNEFERGELYCKNLSGNDDYQKLNTEVALFGCAAAGNVYIKVEKEIDWRDESHRYLANKTGFHWSTPIAEVINDESGCSLELCRVALRANGEIE